MTPPELPDLATLIAEAKRHDKAMTAGPWDDSNASAGYVYNGNSTPVALTAIVWRQCGPNAGDVANAAGITWLRNNIGLLVAHLEASELELQVARKELHELRAERGESP